MSLLQKIQDNCIDAIQKIILNIKPRNSSYDFLNKENEHFVSLLRENIYLSLRCKSNHNSDELYEISFKYAKKIVKKVLNLNTTDEDRKYLSLHWAEMIDI